MSGRPRRAEPAAGEAGVTLIEVVMAVAIMAIAFAAIVGGLASAVMGADLQRRQAKADVALRGTAESVVYDPCGTAATYTSDPRTQPAPAGFTVTIDRVSYWDQDSNQFQATAPPADCAAAPPLQLLELHVDSTVGRLVTRSLQVVKRP